MTSVAGEGCTPNTNIAVGTASFESGGKSGKLVKLVLHPAAAACSAKVYAGQTATGNPIAQLVGAASGSSVECDFAQFTPFYTNGYTVVVAGTGATADVYTKPLN